MHVYHYAAYEVTALKRLTCEYGTREEELDDLLRDEVFVDLYKVVSQGLRLSHERYGLKQVETFYFERKADLRAGDDSILLYEEWLERHEPADPRRRSRPTTRRTASRRCSCATGCCRCGPGAAPPPEEQRAARAAARARPRPRSSAPRCSPGCPTIRHDVAEADRPRWLLAQLLLYHRREEKPVWWAFFDRIGRTSEELQERDSDAIGGLEPAGPPIGSGESLVWPFRFPAQQHHLGAGRRRLRPGDRRARRARSRRSTRRRGRSRSGAARALEDVPLPAALIPGGPYTTPEQQAALRRLARSVLAGDDALRARPSRCSSASRSRRALPQDDLEAAKRARRGSRRPAPRDPGAARVGEDLHRRAADRPA